MYMPRGKLLALIAFVVAASMVTATGAFTSVTAERNVDVNVAGDKNAYLALEPGDGKNGKEYATMNNGELAVNLDSDNENIDGQGVNPNATTTIDHVFKITNKGSQDVNVKITTGKNSSTDAVTFYTGSNPKNSLEDGKRLNVGAKPMKVGIKVDTTKGVSRGQIMDSIQIKANALDHKGNTTAK